MNTTNLTLEIRRSNKGYRNTGIKGIILLVLAIIYTLLTEYGNWEFLLIVITIFSLIPAFFFTLYFILPKYRIIVIGGELRLINGKEQIIKLRDIIRVTFTYKMIHYKHLRSYPSHIIIEYHKNNKISKLKLGTFSWNLKDLHKLFNHLSIYSNDYGYKTTIKGKIP